MGMGGGQNQANTRTYNHKVGGCTHESSDTPCSVFS